MPETIFDKLGIAQLSPEQKARIIDQSAEIVQAKLLIRLMESLGPEKQSELREILDSKSSESLSEFIYKEAPDFTQWVEEETVAYAKELEELEHPD